MKKTLGATAFIVSVLSDFVLQFWVNSRAKGQVNHNIILYEYYERHGMFESAVIAGGTMYILAEFYDAFGFSDKLLNATLTSFVFGGICDAIWRTFNLYSTLAHSYYDYVGNYIYSFFWGGASMTFIVLIHILFVKPRPDKQKSQKEVENKRPIY